MELTLKVTPNQLKAAWEAIGSVLNKGIPSPADAGLLMQTMSKVAQAVEHPVYNDGQHIIKLSQAESTGLWHCMNIAINNDFFTNEGRQSLMLEFMSEIAPKLDLIINTLNANNGTSDKTD